MSTKLNKKKIMRKALEWREKGIGGLGDLYIWLSGCTPTEGFWIAYYAGYDTNWDFHVQVRLGLSNMCARASQPEQASQ